jgi:hypothetical protein
MKQVGYVTYEKQDLLRRGAHVVTLHGLLPVEAFDKFSQNCHEAYTV